MKKILIWFVIFSGNMALAAGGMEGGGGKSVVCRNSDGTIKSAELLDIYEGRTEYGLTIPSASSDMTSQVSLVVQNLSMGRGQDFNDELTGWTNLVIAKKNILPNGTALVPIDDAANVILPQSCNIEQMVNFTAENEILINGEIWNKLDITNQAATILHEALYKLFRYYGATNSRLVRKSVAMGFAGQKTDDIWAGVPTQFLYCATTNTDGSPFPGSQFHAYEDSQGNLIFQFDYLDGDLMLTKSTAQVDQISLSQILDGQVPDTNYGLVMDTGFDAGVGIVLSFHTEILNGKSQTVMKIDTGNAPEMPIRQFSCGK